MKRWKRNICLLLCLGMIFPQAACGTDEKTDADVSDKIPDQDTEDTSGDGVENSSTDFADNAENHVLHLAKTMVNEYAYDEELSMTLAYLKYPSIQLSESCEEEHPALTEALVEVNQSEEEKLREEYELILPEAQADAADDPEYFGCYSLDEQVLVRRADCNVLSMLYQEYTYYGGAHGASFYFSRNIDPATGQVLKLSDVVTDVNALPDLLEAELLENYDLDMFYGTQDIKSYIEEELDDLAWVMEYQGLSVYFSPYEVGSYASGAFHVMIPFTERPDLFVEKYTMIPETYGIELLTEDPYYYDFDQDGKADKLEICGEWDEYGDGIIKHKISLNGNVFENETWSYGMTAKLLHVKEGQTYLYIQDASDNDCRNLTVYDLSKGHTEKVGDVYAGWHTEYLDGGDHSYTEQEEVLADPMDFKLDSRTDLLSTVNGYKNYSVDDSGMPISEDLWYVLQSPLSFTLKKDLNVVLIDEKTGENIGETTLLTGGTVEYYGTDSASIAILRLPDGALALVTVETADWPRTIDGVDIEKIFDGTVFAG